MLLRRRQTQLKNVNEVINTQEVSCGFTTSLLQQQQQKCAEKAMPFPASLLKSLRKR